MISLRKRLSTEAQPFRVESFSDGSCRIVFRNSKHCKIHIVGNLPIVSSVLNRRKSLNHSLCFSDHTVPVSSIQNVYPNICFLLDSVNKSEE